MVVIGAGPAGLGAAHQLKKLGAQVSCFCILLFVLIISYNNHSKREMYNDHPRMCLCVCPLVHSYTITRISI